MTRVDVNGTQRPRLPHPAHQTARASRSMSHPPRVSPALYQKMASELEQANHQMALLLAEKQHLEARNQRLQYEVNQVRQELESTMTQGLSKLSRLVDPVQSTPASPRISQQPPQPLNSAPTAQSSASLSEKGSSGPYTFLERLKQRKADVSSVAPPVSQSSPPTPPVVDEEATEIYNYGSSSDASSYGSLTAFDDPSFFDDEDDYTEPMMSESTLESGQGESLTKPRRRSRSQRRGSRPVYTDSRGDMGADSDLLEDLSLDTQDSDYSGSLYQRAKERESSSEQPLWVWLIAALLLIVASFGAGFLVVQPWLRSNTPAETAQ